MQLDFPKYRLRCGFCRDLINPPMPNDCQRHAVAMARLRLKIWEERLYPHAPGWFANYLLSLYSCRKPELFDSGLFSCPKYPPAKPYPYNFQGCGDIRNTIEKGHFNLDTPPQQTPFSWYPRGSCIEEPSPYKRNLGKFRVNYATWRYWVRRTRDSWLRHFHGKGPCIYSNGLDFKEKGFNKWLAAAKTKILYLNRYFGETAKPTSTHHQFNKNSDIYNLNDDGDKIGLASRSEWLTNKATPHPIGSNFAARPEKVEPGSAKKEKEEGINYNKGRLNGPFCRFRCLIDRCYHKKPRYSDESNLEIKKDLKKKFKLSPEDLEFNDYYKYNTQEKIFGTYYKFPSFFVVQYKPNREPMFSLAHFRHVLSFSCAVEAPSTGWISWGKTEDKKLKAYLSRGTRLYAAPVPTLVVKHGGGPLKRTGIYHIPGNGLVPYSGNLDPSDETTLRCDSYIRYRIAWEKRPNAADEDIGIVYTHEEDYGDDYEEPDWSTGGLDPSDENVDFGRVIPELDGTFLGEKYLLQIEEGSPAIHLDKDSIVHYCPKWHDAQNNESRYMWRKLHEKFRLMALPPELGKPVQRRRSNISRTVWYIEPKNPKDCRWFCLSCVKNADITDLGLLKKWYSSDIDLIKAIGKMGRKAKSSDHKLEIHHYSREYHEPNPKLEVQKLDKIIQNYIRDYSPLPFSVNTLKSFYHYEHTRDDDYLRTAVLTTLKEMENNPYQPNKKGGRPPSMGAKSIIQWCKQNFTSTVPLSRRKEDIIVSMNIKFDSRKIKDISKNIKNR